MTAQTVIASVMTRQPVAVEASLDIRTAQKVMIERNFRHLPVVDGERLIGVVSDRDVLLAQIANHGLASAVAIGDACSLTPYIVAPDTALADVLEAMASRHIGSALVAEDGRLVGIYTATDACRHFAQGLRSQAL